MPLRLTALSLDAHDPARAAAFWGALLAREVVDDPAGLLLPGSDTQVGLRFVASAQERPRPDQVHLHVTSDGGRDQDATVAEALRLGAVPVDVGQRPDEGHIVLADPDGNAFCVIEPDNGYLAGCGPLGELACDGTRAVGLFWSRALAWPLVWDQDEETAVQSPAGGTKVAWGGPPLAPRPGRAPQRLELTVDQGGEADAVDRLLALGAMRSSGAARPGVVALADPDGTEFTVTVH